MKKRFLAALAGLILIAGCTTMAPEATFHPTAAATNTGLSKATVHVRLVITANVQTTVKYSDGVTTRTTEVPGQGTPVEFDAPTPWIVAGTATTALSAPIGCELYVDGALVNSVDISKSGSMFAWCAATQDNATTDDDTGPGKVIMDGSAEKPFWMAWSADGSASGDTSGAGSMTAVRHVSEGTARMIVVATEKSQAPAICLITFGGAILDSQGAIHRGDIATCSGTIK